MLDPNLRTTDLLTPLSEEAAALALKEGWRNVFDEIPTIEQLSLLWSQSALETGRWKFIHNNNFGNIKVIPGHVYSMFRCNEIINGKTQWFDPPHPQTAFCAYLTPEAGAEAYIRFLAQKKRYQPAWQEVINGNPQAFCHQLKVSGYYTASETLYTKGVVSLVNEFKRKFPNILTESEATS